MAKDFLSSLQAKFGSGITGSNLDALDPWVEVSVDSLVDVMAFLRDDSQFAFDMLNCITVVDFCEPDPKKAKKFKFDEHLELVYHLSSIQLKHTLVVKVMLPRWKNGVEGELPEVPTLSDLWRTADWHERETYDLSGIRFLGHPDHTRILCPEDWVGHPLRKDYEMPLDYHGIRGR